MTDPSNVYPSVTETAEDTAALTASDPSQTEPSFSSPEGISPIIPVFPVPLNSVSGRYRGTLGSFQMELRVDVGRYKADTPGEW